MEVTIVIPNYNGLRFLKDCLKSLANQSYTGYKLLVVDNGSTDGSKEWLRQEAVPFIDLDENLGFAGGCNAALRQVDTEFVILLNNDTEVFPDYVEQLLRSIQVSERIFAVSPLMINAKQKDLVDDAGDGLCLLGWAYQIGVGENIAAYTKRRAVFSACAGAAIYRMRILREIGFFDEMHFAYLEDIDLGFRARLAGYENIYEPAAKVYHLGSATSGSKYNPFKVKLAARNNIYLHYKNQSNIMLIINFVPLLLGVLIKLGFFFGEGFGEAYAAGLEEGLRTAHKCRRADFQKAGRKRLLDLEIQMLKGCFDYVGHFIKRRWNK